MVYKNLNCLMKAYSTNRGDAQRHPSYVLFSPFIEGPALVFSKRSYNSKNYYHLMKMFGYFFYYCPKGVFIIEKLKKKVIDSIIELFSTEDRIERLEFAKLIDHFRPIDKYGRGFAQWLKENPQEHGMTVYFLVFRAYDSHFSYGPNFSKLLKLLKKYKPFLIFLLIKY